MKVQTSTKALATVAVLSLVTLAGCSSTDAEPSTSTAPTTDAAPQLSGSITVWVDADRAGVLADVASDFTENTGVTVELVEKEFGDIRDDFTTQVPTGQGPDIIVGAHDWLGKLVQNGVVAPIELGDRAGEFQEVAVNAMSYEGNTYGLPYSIENIAMLRNVDLAPEAPESFDDLLATGDALMASGDAEYAFLVGLDPNAADPYHLYPLQASFGSTVFELNEDGTYDPEKLAMGGDAGEAFATALAAWGSAGVLNTNISGDIALEEFRAGKSAFLLTGPWNVPAIKESGINYSIDAIPSAGGSPATPFVGVQGFYVSSQSENRLAANEFLVNYIGTEAVQTALYEVGGRAPALTAAFEAAQSNPDVAAFGAVGAAGVPMPNVPAMDMVWSDWGTAEVAIINGAGDPVELWRTMVASIENSISAG